MEPRKGCIEIWPSLPPPIGSASLNLVGGDPALMLFRRHVEGERLQRHVPLRQSGGDLRPVLLDDDGLRYDDVATEFIADLCESGDDEAPPRHPVLEVSDRPALL